MRSKRPQIQLICSLLVLLLFAFPAAATWAEPDETAPLERVVQNVKAFLAEHPGDVYAYYILGRVHSLAYALGKEEFEVYQAQTAGNSPRPPSILDPDPFDMKSPAEPDARGRINHLEQSAQSFFEGLAHMKRDEPLASQLRLAYGWTAQEAAKYAADVAFPAPAGREREPLTDEQRSALSSLASRDPETVREAQTRLQPAARQAAPELRDLARAGNKSAKEVLQRAWEQTALDAYRRVLRDEMESVREYKYYSPLAVEAGEGIIAILEKRSALSKEHKKEVRAVRESIQRVGRYPRQVTPLLFPLRDGQSLAEVLNSKASVSFDLDGFGRDARWPWVAPDAALLAWDPQRSGRVDSGRRLIGSATWWLLWQDGFQVLAALDDNADGWLRGDELAGLAVWVDADANAVSDPGEVTPIETFGVEALAVTAQGRSEGALYRTDGVRLRDGRTLPLYDWEPQSKP